jgi:hypothetical protein
MEEEESTLSHTAGVTSAVADTMCRRQQTMATSDGAVKDPAYVAACGAMWKAVALTSTILVFLLTLGAALFFFYTARSETRLNNETLNRMEQKIQQLSAGISFDSRRRQLLLGIRDEIMTANPRIDLNDAYRYSELILRASEKFPSVDPLLLLSIGIVESGFKREAVSPADARGLYQIQPSTGRLLARGLNWEFSKDMLFDPEKNTEMASLYLDILFATYADTKLVLAEYNGGPLNAALFKAGSSRVSPETKDYVAKVLDVRHRLENRFEYGIDVQADRIDLDSTRAKTSARADHLHDQYHRKTQDDKSATASE